MEANSSVFCASQNPSALYPATVGEALLGAMLSRSPSPPWGSSLAVRGRFPGTDPDREGGKWAGAGQTKDTKPVLDLDSQLDGT